MEKPVSAPRLMVMRLTEDELKQFKFTDGQKALVDSAELAMVVKSRISKDEILRDRIITMSVHFMASGTAQVGLPKEEAKKYKNRVTAAFIYPIYTPEELIALVVTGEVKEVSIQKPIFLVIPKEPRENQNE